jgi:cytochrome c oxidase subunit 1
MHGFHRRAYNGGRTYEEIANDMLPEQLWWLFGKNNYLFLNEVMTTGAIVMAVAQIPFIINFFWSIWGGRKITSDNPWNATTMEWNTPTPPPHGNFIKEPVAYRGPYEYSLPGVESDYTPQWEKSPGQPEPVIAALPGTHHH